MHLRRSLIIRLGLCLLLGAATSWIVAWGLATAEWAGWVKPGESSSSFSFTIDEPYLVDLSRSVYRFETIETWGLARLDAGGSTGQWAKNKADQWLTREEQRRADQPDAPLVRLQTTVVPGPARAGQPTVRFQGTGLPSIAASANAVLIHRTSVGWPKRSISRAETTETATGTRMQFFNWTTISRMVDGWQGRVSIPLELPLRPIWPGLLLNTTFYGALWALPLFGLPLVKQSRRRRKGRCPRCNYDLKRHLEQGCPECGWGKSGGEAPRVPTPPSSARRAGRE